MHDRHPRRIIPILAIRFTSIQLLSQIVRAVGSTSTAGARLRSDIVAVVAKSITPSCRSGGRQTAFQILGALFAQDLFVFASLGGFSGTVEAADFGDAEDGFPALEHDRIFVDRGRVAEACGREGPFRPAVVDAGEVPVDFVGRGVAVELVAHVDEVLDAGDVDVVDGAEVEDYGLERWPLVVVGWSFAAAWAGVVPGAVL